MDFEMQMRAGRATGRADFGDCLARLYAFARLYQQFRVMRVQGAIAVVMIDHDDLAVMAVCVSSDHRALSDRLYRRADGRGHVDATMEYIAVAERIVSMTEVRCDARVRDRQLRVELMKSVDLIRR